MERKCSQSIKIQFPIKVFHGTDVVVNIPKSGNMIKNIRLVLDFVNSPNTLGERILERAEFMSSDNEILEIVHGEFIHVYNNFSVPIERKDTLEKSLCTNEAGIFYMKIPFHFTENDGFFIFEDTPKVRLLFNNSLENEEIHGYLMVDYYITDSVPKTPYIQKIKQIQKFTAVTTGASSVKMHVYAVGSVYELFFTVKDTTTGTYVDAIKNIKLFFGEKERFNLSGHYLRYVEPMKRYGVFPREPMYMYSFCEYPKLKNIPSGSTNFYENSFFELDMLANDSEYEITIWAQSHNFVHMKESKSTLMFNSTEMLLDVTSTTTSNFTDIPMRVSYTDFAGSINVYYSSDYEITNVSVDSDIPSYNIYQDSISFQKIDSVNTSYYANVTFSAQGFSDTMCYFKFIGSGMYLENMIYSETGNYPTHIDYGQNFHYILDNTFDSNVIFSSTDIQTFTIDKYKNYTFTSYVPASTTSSGFTGPGSIVSTYDQDMNSLYTITSVNSNVCAPHSNVFGFYGYNITVNGYTGIPALHQGVILNLDTSVLNYFNAGSTSKVYVDAVYTVSSSYVLASIRVESSSSSFTGSPGAASTSFGIGTARTAFVKITNGVPSFISILSGSNMSPKTSVYATAEGKCAWGYAYTSTSTLSNPANTYSTSGGYSVGYFDIIANTREWNINVACTPSTMDMKIIVGDTLGNVYLIAGYTSASTPTLAGFTFEPGDGFMVLKINKTGTVLYALSFIGSGINQVYPILDNTTGKFMLSISTTSGVTMYNNGVEKYSDIGLYQFFIFDDFGNINSTQINLAQYFSTPKPIYFLPPTYASYYKNPQQVPAYAYWDSLVTGPSSENIKSLSTDSDGHIYYSYTCANYSDIYDKYGYTSVRTPSNRRTVLSKMYSNCVYGGYTISLTNTSTGQNWVAVKNYVYLLCTTEIGSTTLYDKTGTSVFTFTSTTETLLLLRFRMDGTYDSWYMHIPSSYGHKVKIDTNNNIYVTGFKSGTSSRAIYINGSSVSTIPVTANPYTSFLIKINSSHGLDWRAYIDGGSDGITYVRFVSSIVDSAGNVYLSGTKGTATAYINGSVTDTIPVTLNLSAYIVKFDSSGLYASWYTHIDGTVIDDVCDTRELQITPSNEVAMVMNIGSFNGTNNIFTVYVNGTSVPSTLTKKKNVSGALVKYTSGGLYDWNVGFGATLSGNYSNFTSLVIDTTGNFLINGSKQAYVFSVYDKNGNSGGEIPAGIGDMGVIMKINSDGTYSNNYGYFETTWNDGSSAITTDNNGNIITSGFLGGNTGGNLSYVYDKNGYVTSTNSYDLTTSYGFIVKFNENFTMNKISI